MRRSYCLLNFLSWTNPFLTLQTGTSLPKKQGKRKTKTPSSQVSSEVWVNPFWETGNIELLCWELRCQHSPFILPPGHAGSVLSALLTLHSCEHLTVIFNRQVVERPPLGLLGPVHHLLLLTLQSPLAYAALYFLNSPPLCLNFLLFPFFRPSPSYAWSLNMNLRLHLQLPAIFTFYILFGGILSILKVSTTIFYTEDSHSHSGNSPTQTVPDFQLLASESCSTPPTWMFLCNSELNTPSSTLIQLSFWNSSTVDTLKHMSAQTRNLKSLSIWLITPTQSIQVLPDESLFSCFIYSLLYPYLFPVSSLIIS